MKSINKITLALTILLFSSCVQKTFKHTVVFMVDVSKVENIQKVGIRGENKPLSWNTDSPMTAVQNDSLYKTSITFKTGYKFVACKFTINDEFEFQDQQNRRVDFSNKNDTTYYKAVFNSRN